MIPIQTSALFIIEFKVPPGGLSPLLAFQSNRYRGWGSQLWAFRSQSGIGLPKQDPWQW